MKISSSMNKNINMPLLGISIVIVVGLIWAVANFFNIKSEMVSEKRNNLSMEFDAAAFQAEQQDLAAAESDVSFLSQDDTLSGEIDMALNDISEASESALDEKSLADEALFADISGDISALDNGIVQNEIDQSLNDVVQY